MLKYNELFIFIFIWLTVYLGLPLVMKSCGIVLGTIFLAFFAYLSDYSLSLLHKSSQMLIENRKDQKYGILRGRVVRC